MTDIDTRPKQFRRPHHSTLGIVVAVLVATVDGMEICDVTPKPLSEGDFVYIRNSAATFAESLSDEGRGRSFTVAEKLLKRQEAFIRWMKSKRER